MPNSLTPEQRIKAVIALLGQVETPDEIVARLNITKAELHHWQVLYLQGGNKAIYADYGTQLDREKVQQEPRVPFLLTPTKRKLAVTAVIEGYDQLSNVAKRFGVPEVDLSYWLDVYQELGEYGLEASSSVNPSIRTKQLMNGDRQQLKPQKLSVDIDKLRLVDDTDETRASRTSGSPSIPLLLTHSLRKKAVIEVIEGEEQIEKVANMFGVPSVDLSFWIDIYCAAGFVGLENALTDISPSQATLQLMRGNSKSHNKNTNKHQMITSILANVRDNFNDANDTIYRVSKPIRQSQDVRGCVVFFIAISLWALAWFVFIALMVGG